MSVVDYMKAFLEHKEKLDEVERQGTYATGEESYEEEFRKLRELSQSYRTDNVYPSAEAEKSGNVPRNRFKDIVPFDYTRVKLKTVEEGSTSDYINASFIRGAIGDQKYIAAQGPLPKTVNDFWQMLWENDVRVVLMACREYEGQPPKLKCQRYWPNSTTEELLFGNIRVTLEKEEQTSYKEHLIRHMVAKVDDTSREIVQFHYLDWPDAGVPRSIPGVLDLIERLRQVQPLNAKETPPVLFHCSAGCGRTGTMIVIDFVISLLQYGKLSKDFKLYDVIVDLRRQRMAIVQSLEQYVFVHEAIASLFKRQLENIDSRIYSNVKLKPNAKPTEPEYGNILTLEAQKEIGPVKSNSLKERPRPEIVYPKPRQMSDTNAKSSENSAIEVSYVLHEAVKTKTQSPAYLNARKASTDEFKPPISPKSNPKKNLTNAVPCKYELTETQNKETFSDKDSSGTKMIRIPCCSSSVEVEYEVVQPAGLHRDKGRHQDTLPLAKGKKVPQVTTNNAPIIYKGINISYPNRYSKKPRGKRPFAPASATARAF